MDHTARKYIILGLFVSIFASIQAQNTVKTPESATFWRGSNESLTCAVTGSALKVSWKRGPDVNNLKDIIAWSPEGGVLPAENSGRYNMSLDFTLSIHDVTLSDAEIYFCIVKFDASSFSLDQTSVQVYAEPDHPYPSIDQCVQDSDREGPTSEPSPCVIELAASNHTVNLTCRADHFYPNITLDWSVWGRLLEPIREVRVNHSDGTWSQLLTVTAENTGLSYICSASGSAVRDGERKVAEVVVQMATSSTSPSGSSTEKPEGTMAPLGGSPNVGMIIGIVVAVIVGLLAVVFAVYKLKTRRDAKKAGQNMYKHTYKGVSGKIEDQDEAKAVSSGTEATEDNWKTTESSGETPQQDVGDGEKIEV